MSYVMTGRNCQPAIGLYLEPEDYTPHTAIQFLKYMF